MAKDTTPEAAEPTPIIIENATPTAPEETPEPENTDPTANKADKEGKLPRYLTVTLPDELTKQVIARAEEQDTTVAAMLRILIAGEFNFDLSSVPMQARHQKYNTEEERKAAQKTARLERQALVNMLLAEHKAKIAAQAAAA